MKQKTLRTFVGDFETTVYEGQESTEVWASAVVELYREDVKILHSIDETFEYLKSLKCNLVIYYHNLKFDGAFWLDYLINVKKFEQAVTKIGDGELDIDFIEEKNMKSNTFAYMISDMGQWYNITIKIGKYFIYIRDSLKLLPFSVKKIGKSFGTKHKKLDMEYTGYRYAGCTITPEEEKYIANDVLVVKEALEIMYNEGHKKLTIGSCCLDEYKKTMDRLEYDGRFPDLYQFEISFETYGSTNAGDYIRNSYKGGWCYLVHGKENQVKENGTTADVNSLYPSMMSSESGNKYPVGEPTFWKGDFIPDEAIENNKFYFVRIKTRFYVNPNYLPFIQIKHNMFYKGTECLETSDIYDAKTDRYYENFYWQGNLIDTRVVLTLTMIDYKLIKEHYELVDFEILDGCYFNSEIGLFDKYIEKYKKIKVESKGAIRELAKLFLNNLYGKMASNTNSSFKLAYTKDDGSLGFYQVKQNNKKAGYIPVGSAITSYARNFTIRHAQMNYYGVSNRGFIYADTDSIHCDLKPDEIKGIKVHPTNFCCWKLESCWDKGIFVRQKTYIEHITHEDLEKINEPYYNIKCAGMNQACKDKFNNELENGTKMLKDFKLGLKIFGKLLPKRIKGGIVLVETTYEMR